MSYESNTFNLSNKIFLFESSYDTGAGTQIGVGLSPTFSAAGTFNAATYTGNWASAGKRTLCATSAAANTAAGPYLTSAGPTILGVRSFYTKIATYTDITNIRIWSIWTETTTPGPTFAVSAAPTTGYVGFRFDTSVGDTTWKLIVGKTGTSTQTITDTKVTVQANTLYELQIDPSSNEKFVGSVNGRRVAVNAGAGNGLNSATQLCWYTGATTLTTAQKAINWYHQYLVCG